MSSRYRLPDPSLTWAIPLAAVYILADVEQGPGGGMARKAYRCPAGVPTLAWGETDGVRMGDTCTDEQGDRWLCEAVEERARQVAEACKVDPSPNELGAMVLLQYNIGHGAFLKSSVLRAHNAGNKLAASRAFGLWNKARNPATGQLEVLRGLTARRAREAALYLEPEDGSIRSPQAVETESKLSASPIAQGGTATVAVGTLTAVTQIAPALEHTSGTLETVKTGVGTLKSLVADVSDFIGFPPGVIAAVVLIAIGLWIISQRSKQRSEGWA